MINKQIKLSAEAFVTERADHCIVFNVTNDDVLLKLRGNYQSFLQILKTGCSSSLLNEKFQVSSDEAIILMDYLRKSSLTGERYQFSSGEFVPRTFQLNDAQAEFIDFASLFPTTAEQKIYASYCSCSSGTNCCSVSDICTCAVPPCST